MILPTSKSDVIFCNLEPIISSCGWIVFYQKIGLEGCFFKKAGGVMVAGWIFPPALGNPFFGKGYNSCMTVVVLPRDFVGEMQTLPDEKGVPDDS